jgi:amidase
LAWYLGALDRRDRLIARWHEFFTDVDAIICPVTATTAFAHQEPGVAFTIDGQTVDYGVHGGLNAFSNLCGLPGLSLPTGSDANGLPIGVQLVGPAWSELRLLAIARSFVEQGMLPGFRRPPER